MRQILPIAKLWGYIGVACNVSMANMAISGTLVRILPAVISYPILSGTWALVGLTPASLQNRSKHVFLNSHSKDRGGWGAQPHPTARPVVGESGGTKQNIAIYLFPLVMGHPPAAQTVPGMWNWEAELKSQRDGLTLHGDMEQCDLALAVAKEGSLALNRAEVQPDSTLQKVGGLSKYTLTIIKITIIKITIITIIKQV